MHSYRTFGGLIYDNMAHHDPWLLGIVCILWKSTACWKPFRSFKANLLLNNDAGQKSILMS